MRLVIDNYLHDLLTGACGNRQQCVYERGGYVSVRAMQRELLRRNRGSIRAKRRCCVLTSEGVVFYEFDAQYHYRTVQHVRLIP